MGQEAARGRKDEDRLFRRQYRNCCCVGCGTDFGEEIKAIVSRGGRPDLAKEALGKVIAPALLIVGGEDHVVMELNKKAYEIIRAEKQLKIIPGATHLFEEPGALEEVVRLAAEWFRKYFITEPKHAGI
ncbi:MAG: alpha/beta hydrolase [Nitrospira sp.]|nr:alpha/beta hydrolase [Nitrospira sp.]